MGDGQKRPKAGGSPETTGRAQPEGPGQGAAAVEPPSGEADEFVDWDEEPDPGSSYESL